MKDDGQEHGLLETAINGGSMVASTDVSETAKATVSLQDLRKAVDVFETFARSLSARKRRSQFKIVD